MIILCAAFSVFFYSMLVSGTISQRFVFAIMCTVVYFSMISVWSSIRDANILLGKRPMQRASYALFSTISIIGMFHIWSMASGTALTIFSQFSMIHLVSFLILFLCTMKLLADSKIDFDAMVSFIGMRPPERIVENVILGKFAKYFYVIGVYVSIAIGLYTLGILILN